MPGLVSVSCSSLGAPNCGTTAGAHSSELLPGVALVTQSFGSATIPGLLNATVNAAGAAIVPTAITSANAVRRAVNLRVASLHFL